MEFHLLVHHIAATAVIFYQIYLVVLVGIADRLVWCQTAAQRLINEIHNVFIRSKWL